MRGRHGGSEAERQVSPHASAGQYEHDREEHQRFVCVLRELACQWNQGFGHRPQSVRHQLYEDRPQNRGHPSTKTRSKSYAETSSKNFSISR